MILGIGIDIIELDRIEKLLTNEKFIKRILTPNEQDQLANLKSNRQIEFLAGRFAAKEAYSKAVGTGIGENLSFQQIEVAVTEKGQPYIITSPSSRAHLSISHSNKYAVAQVVIEQINVE